MSKVVRLKKVFSITRDCVMVTFRYRHLLMVDPLEIILLLSVPVTRYNTSIKLQAWRSDMPNALMEGKKVQDWANLVLAACVFISPWVIGFVADATASWNAWIVGLLLGGLAVAAISAFAEWEEWVNLVLGLWLAASPWLLGFAANVNVMWTNVVLGLLVAVVSLWAVWDHHHPHAHA